MNIVLEMCGDVLEMSSFFITDRHRCSSFLPSRFFPHRISDVLGFSRREIISNSFYNLYHVLDADNVLTAIKNRKLSTIFSFLPSVSNLCS